MTFLQAFVICFIAYLIYKLIKPTGLSKSDLDGLKKDISVAFATAVKKASLENKTTVALCHDDLRSGDIVRVDAAIKKIEAIFDKDIADSDEILAKYKDKPEAPISTPTSNEIKIKD